MFVSVFAGLMQWSAPLHHHKHCGFRMHDLSSFAWHELHMHGAPYGVHAPGRCIWSMMHHQMSPAGEDCLHCRAPKSVLMSGRVLRSASDAGVPASVALSQLCITTSALAGSFFCLLQTHPDNPETPLVDYLLGLFMLPGMLFGVVIGAFPDPCKQAVRISNPHLPDVLFSGADVHDAGCFKYLSGCQRELLVTKTLVVACCNSCPWRPLQHGVVVLSTQMLPQGQIPTKG